jgi:transposase
LATASFGLSVAKEGTKMADSANATVPTNWVALDIARYWNAVLVETAVGKRHRFKMANSAADFDRLVRFLRALAGPVRIALEPTGDYHRPIAHRLLSEGFDVVSIGSVAQARYREAMFNSWDKNDPKDALVLLEMLKRGAVQRYIDPMIAGHHDIQELAKTYYQVTKARTKLQHSLINRCLPLYFPEMHRYWATTRNEWFVRFLLAFPTARHVRALEREAFVQGAWELVGRKVVIVANLQPATLMGVESNGMVLAASIDGEPSLISVDAGVPAGTKVR